jgi:hypothetical protein
VWGDGHPSSVLGSVQNYAFQLRRLLRDDDRAEPPIVRQAPDYLIDIAAEDLNVGQFQAPRRRALCFEQFRMGRGERTVPADARNVTWAAAGGARRCGLGPSGCFAMQERRAGREQDLVTALPGRAVTLSSRLRAEQPLGEPICWLHMITSYRAGRQVETFGEYTQAMTDGLGLNVDVAAPIMLTETPRRAESPHLALTPPDARHD